MNVGWKAGAIRYLEMFLGRALQWQVCLLHGNELPFRALFTYYDGPTTGPTSYSGEIGSQLKEHLSSRDIVDFKRIPNPDFPILPDEVLQDLSWDQKLLYEFCSAVMSGNWPEDLLYEHGGLNHSRWLTTAERILCLYVRTQEPSVELTRLATIVVKFYAPMWFTIKSNPLITDAP